MSLDAILLFGHQCRESVLALATGQDDGGMPFRIRILLGIEHESERLRRPDQKVVGDIIGTQGRVTRAFAESEVNGALTCSVRDK